MAVTQQQPFLVHQKAPKAAQTSKCLTEISSRIQPMIYVLRRRLVTVYAAVTRQQPPLVQQEAPEVTEAPHKIVMFDCSWYYSFNVQIKIRIR